MRRDARSAGSAPAQPAPVISALRFTLKATRGSASAAGLELNHELVEVEPRDEAVSVEIGRGVTGLEAHHKLVEILAIDKAIPVEVGGTLARVAYPVAINVLLSAIWRRRAVVALIECAIAIRVVRARRATPTGEYGGDVAVVQAPVEASPASCPARPAPRRAWQFGQAAACAAA